MDERVGVEPIHVWEFIAEELAARGWTVWDLAARMSDKHTVQVHVLALELLEVSKDMPHENVVLGDLAHDLAAAFGTSPEFWTNLHAQWRATHSAQTDPK